MADEDLFERAALAGVNFFTVVADYGGFIADTTADTDADPDFVAVTATVTFTPLISAGDALMLTQALPRPLGVFVAPVVGIVDGDGRLKLRPKSDDGVAPFTPVRLLADTPFLELKTPLYYRVSFTGVKFAGNAASLAPFVFQAANADVEVNLIQVGRQPGQPASGITKIAPGAVRLLDDGTVQFSFGGVDIPDPMELEITAPLATWNNLPGRPLVHAAGADQQAAADAIAAVRGNGTGLTLWTGTAAEFAAIAVKDPNTVYVVR